jgi:hypothetical protein
MLQVYVHVAVLLQAFIALKDPPTYKGPLETPRKIYKLQQPL